MMRKKFTCLVLFVTLLPLFVRAQNAATIVQDTVVKKDTARQTDLIDIGKSLFHIRPHPMRQERDKKLYFSMLPSGPAGRW